MGFLFKAFFPVLFEIVPDQCQIWNLVRIAPATLTSVSFECSKPVPKLKKGYG